MANLIKSMAKAKRKEVSRKKKIKLRKHLNADALFSKIYVGFSKIEDHRPGNVQHSLADTLMAGFAMFSLKDASLLLFDERRRKSPHNLMSIYGMKSIPCDTSIRAILDDLVPDALRSSYQDAFRALQRGKVLERMVFMQGAYLLNLDGTGYFSSSKLYSEACMKKVNKKTGKVIYYYMQAVGAVIAHPSQKEVIPLCPEIIKKQDGEQKMDCERNAVKRLLKKFRQDHPHLKVIVNEDALASNAPHIEDLEEYGCHYILGVKEGDHKFLFQYVNQAVEADDAVTVAMTDENQKEIKHSFRILYDMPLNKSNSDKRVTFVEYWEENTETGKVQRFTWITDLDVDKDNVYRFMRGARARWKIENETFNTLKNQGYNFGHNYGLGKRNLSEVFVLLMMLAFLVDQIQQLCCPLFNKARKAWKSKRSLWEKIRCKFHEFQIETMEDLYRSILHHKQVPLVIAE